MGQISPILRDTEDNGLMFWCPGCQEAHRIQHGSGLGPRWGWNGDVNKPTFTPSVLVTGKNFTPNGEADFDAWHDAGCPTPAPTFESMDLRCHTFVTDGRIQFLSDCTHALAGQTVDLPAWPERIEP